MTAAHEGGPEDRAAGSPTSGGRPHAGRPHAGRPNECPTVGGPTRRRRGAFFWFALLLVAAELGAAWRLPYRHLPRAAEVPRNVRSHRGFPEYLSGPVRGEHPLAIVVGNSQAVGIEVGDPQAIWFAHLRRALAAGPGPRVDAENWSHGGLRTAELELLTVAALERRPDLLVFVLHYRNFDPPEARRLSATSADTPLLIGRPSLWPGLERTLLAGQLDLDRRLLACVKLNSSFARMRNPILDRLSHVVPDPWHRSVFGHHRDPGDVFGEGHQHSTEGLPTPERRARWVALGGLEESLAEVAAMDAGDVDRRLASVAEVTASIEALTAEAGTAVLWVWAPVDLGIVPEDVVRNPDAFYAGATERVTSAGGRVVDLRDALPHGAFVSLTHFGVEGHLRMAALMEPVIRDALP